VPEDGNPEVNEAEYQTNDECEPETRKKIIDALLCLE
jgi:hypothetical protein